MNYDTRFWHEATFYSIYPLGYCDAPRHNDGSSAPESRIRALIDDLDRIAELGFTALYLGPLFESGSHGYDTHDYFNVDRRLGTNEDLADVVAAAHDRGIRVVIDGVYNHVGRGFGPFDDLRERGRESRHDGWFRGVDFSRDNRFGDGFTYEGWEGVEDLVALNHDNPEVREHLIAAALFARDGLGVDGIRLDVAYSLPLDFIEELSSRLGAADGKFWLLGEVIHGGYADFLADGRLQSVTNYECYKGLWSSFNDRNMHEIAHTLRRLFGQGGLLCDAMAAGRLPYGFADNHDVSRVASTLETHHHLYPLHGILWTMPGIPSVYYGSEYAIAARKEEGDSALRPPRVKIDEARASSDGELAGWITRLNRVRRTAAALVRGEYRELSVDSSTLAYERRVAGESVIVAVNANPEPARVQLPQGMTGRYENLLGGEDVVITGAGVEVPAYGTAVLRRRR